MSNETIVIAQESLFITFSGERITALPDAGVIASLTKTAPDADMIGGLHQSAVAVINGSDLYDVVINVLPNSADDAYFNAGRVITRTQRIIHSLVVTYGIALNWVSDALVITSIGARNLNADSVEVIPVNLRGKFQLAEVGTIANAPTATPSQIKALIPG